MLINIELCRFQDLEFYKTRDRNHICSWIFSTRPYLKCLHFLQVIHACAHTQIIKGIIDNNKKFGIVPVKAHIYTSWIYQDQCKEINVRQKIPKLGRKFSTWNAISGYKSIFKGQY